VGGRSNWYDITYKMAYRRIEYKVKNKPLAFIALGLATIIESVMLYHAPEVLPAKMPEYYVTMAALPVMGAALIKKLYDESKLVRHLNETVC